MQPVWSMLQFPSSQHVEVDIGPPCRIVCMEHLPGLASCRIRFSITVLQIETCTHGRIASCDSRKCAHTLQYTNVAEQGVDCGCRSWHVMGP